MNARIGLVLLSLALAPTARAGDAPRFAVAGGRGADACVALPSAARAGHRIDVLLPDGGVFHAHLGGRLSAPCAALANALLDGSFHSIVFDGAVPPGRWFGVADAGGARVEVLACTSEEGLHLSAWAGAPRRSERLWHDYVYLGYDVEPTCEGGDDTAE